MKNDQQPINYEHNNLELWNEWVKINASSSLYQLQRFKQGENKLNPLELEEVGNVQGRSLLHLQCHFGMDTLSWARLGARVTGVDFSDEAIALAKALSRELRIPGDFVCSNIYDLPQHLEGQFDIVFTSYGILAWLSDLKTWGEIIARYLKPGGFFYIAEFHPFAMVLDDEADTAKVKYSYFDEEVMAFPVQGSYADREAICKTKTSYEWQHTLGEVINSLLSAGLQLDFLHEFPFSTFQQLPYLLEDGSGYFQQPADMPQMPLVFSIKAHKPF